MAADCPPTVSSLDQDAIKFLTRLMGLILAVSCVQMPIIGVRGVVAAT